MTLIKKGSIGKKLLVLIICAVSLPIIFTLGLLFWQQNKLESLVAEIVMTKNMEGLVSGFYDLCQSHKITEQQLVKDTVRSRIIGKTGYFFVLQGTGPNRGHTSFPKMASATGKTFGTPGIIPAVTSCTA